MDDVDTQQAIEETIMRKQDALAMVAVVPPVKRKRGRPRKIPVVD